MLDKVNKILDSFESNGSKVLPVMPVLHGTNEKVAWQICQTGFATVSTLDDGWFGKVIETQGLTTRECILQAMQSMRLTTTPKRVKKARRRSCCVSWSLEIFFLL